MNVKKNEQWKLDGKCSICRRKDYCSKPCTRAKRAEESFIHSAVRNAMLDVLMRPGK